MRKIQKEKFLVQSIKTLNFSVRTQNCLRGRKIRFVGDLVQRTEIDLLKINNFGRISLEEVKAELHQHGLRLEMSLSDPLVKKFNRLTKPGKIRCFRCLGEVFKEGSDFRTTDFKHQEVDEYTCVSGCTMEVEYYSEIRGKIEIYKEPLSFFLKHDVVKVLAGPPGRNK